MEKKKVSLTEGNIIQGILFFAFPILIGNIFQQFYNIADTAIIGNILGDTALAAVGATSPIYNLVIGFANGLTNGFAIILARYYGAKDEKNVKKSVAQIVKMSVGVGVILTALSMLGLKPLLRLLKTPGNVIDLSTEYLMIILGFAMVTIFYNMFAAILRAVGNSKAPLVFLIISTGLNVLLDLAFVKGLALGVAGAAIATVLAQMISAMLCLVYIVKKCPQLHFGVKDLKKDTSFALEIFMMGLSNGLMLAVVSVGSVILQRAVNGFGSQVIAAHSAARKIDDIFMMPIASICMAATTFTGQNLGAKQYDRIHAGVRKMLMLTFGWTVFGIMVIYLFAPIMIRLLTGSTDEVLIRTSLQYVRINILFFFALSVLCVLRSTMQGLGQKIMPLVASLVEFLMKIFAVMWLAPALGYFGVCILEPIIWIICMSIVGAAYLSHMKQMRTSWSIA